MAMGFGGILTVWMAMLSGGATDLLDFIGTEAYWKEKKTTVTVDQLLGELKTTAGADVSVEIAALGLGNFAQREAAAKKILAAGPAALPALQKAVDDPDAEISNRVRGLIQQIQLASKANDVRRLMAIRTLGERKEASALPVLKPLLDSKDMFVADYAARAIARIEGKPLPVRGPNAEALKSDLALLPANVGVVGQASLTTDKGISLDQLLKEIPPQPNEDREEMLQTMTTELIKTAEQIGNVRFEGVTFGVADTIDDKNGFATLIFRGQYDAKAVSLYLNKQANLQPNGIEGLEVFSPERSIAFSFVSNDRAILFTGPTQDKLNIKEIATALRDGKGTLATNADLTKLISTIDPAARMWAVCKVSDSYRQAPVIQAFDTITLVGKQEKDKTHFTLSGAGSDAAKVEAAVNMVNTGINQAKTGMDQMVKMMPAMKPMADMINSTQCKADGKNASLTASMQGDSPAMMFAPFMMFGAVRHEAPAQVAPPVIEEVKPEQPPK